MRVMVRLFFDFLYLYPAQEVTPRHPTRFIYRLQVYGFCFDVMGFGNA